MRWMMALALLMLAGCTEVPPEDAEGADPETTETTTHTVTATTTQTASAVPAQGCTPHVVAQGNGYRASCTVVRALQPGDAPAVDLKTVNGHIEAEPGSKDEATIQMWAQGDDEAEARERLASLRLTVSKAKVHVTSDAWQSRGASIDVVLKQSTVGSLSADTTNGHIDVDDLSGGAWSLDTTNGHIDLDGIRADVTADTTNGHIDVVGEVGELELDATNGRIEAEVTPTKDADWVLDTTNGRITLKIPEDAQRGYDITAETTNGEVSFQTSQMAAQGEQTKTEGHRMTTGFDARAIQVTATLDTTNSDVSIISQGEQDQN